LGKKGKRAGSSEQVTKEEGSGAAGFIMSLAINAEMYAE